MTRDEVYKLIDGHYRENFAIMVKKLSGISGSRHNAEDVVQEAYTRACQYWPSYNLLEGGMDQWMSAILRNCMADMKRDQAKEGAVIDASPDEMLLIYHPHLDEQEALDALKAIENKKPHERDILKLFFYEQYQPADIAQLVPQTNGAIRQVIHRFKQEMRT
jgi:RNA polymerase sigma factor (sigma-70 family)